MIDPKELGLVMSLDYCIRKTEKQVELHEDAIKRARLTTSVQSLKNSMEYFEAILHHLNKLKEMEGRR